MIASKGENEQEVPEDRTKEEDPSPSSYHHHDDDDDDHQHDVHRTPPLQSLQYADDDDDHNVEDDGGVGTVARMLATITATAATSTTPTTFTITTPPLGGGGHDNNHTHHYHHHHHHSQQHGHHRSQYGASSACYLSPDGETPRRITSTNSLIGLDIDPCGGESTMTTTTTTAAAAAAAAAATTTTTTTTNRHSYSSTSHQTVETNQDQIDNDDEDDMVLMGGVFDDDDDDDENEIHSVGQSHTGRGVVDVDDVELSPFTPTSRVDDNDEDDDGNGAGHGEGQGDVVTTPPIGLQGAVSLSPPLLTNYSSNKSEADGELSVTIFSVGENNHPIAVSAATATDTAHPLPAISSLPPPSSSRYRGTGMQQLLPQLATNTAMDPTVPNNHQLLVMNSSANSLPSIVFPPVISSSSNSNNNNNNFAVGGNTNNTNQNHSSWRPPRAPTPPPPPLLSTTIPGQSRNNGQAAAAAAAVGVPSSSPSAASLGALPLLPSQPVSLSQPPSSLGGPRPQQQQQQHVRTNTDSSNCSFLSALTDDVHSFVAPRRRTLSWDHDERRSLSSRSGAANHRRIVEQPPRGGTGGGGTGGGSGRNSRGRGGVNASSAAAGGLVAANGNLAHSPGGVHSMPGNILQPILMDLNEHKSTLPDSIWTSSNGKEQVAGMISVPAVQAYEPKDVPLLERTSHKAVATSSEREMKKDSNDPGELEKQSLPVRYKLSDLLDATKESTEETELIMSIERARIVTDTSLFGAAAAWRRSLLPQISDDRVHDFEPQQQSDRNKSSNSGNNIEKTSDATDPDRRRGAVESISHLTKRLMQVSPTRGHLPCEATNASIASGLQSDRNPNNNLEDALQVFPKKKAAFGSDTDIEADDSGNVLESKRPSRNYFDRFRNFARRAKSNMQCCWGGFGPHQPQLWTNLLRVVSFLMVPSLFVALILFYLAGNPPTGKAYGYAKSIEQASLSWWLLVLGSTTLCIAKCSEIVVIDFFLFRTRAFPCLIGTMPSLLLAMSKGWPFVSLSWGITNLILLFGTRRPAQWWLFWQKCCNIFNEANPSGEVTYADSYRQCIYILIGLGVAVSIKRTIVGTFIGNHVVGNYRVEFTELMKRILLLNEVSSLPMCLNEMETGKSQSNKNGDRFGASTTTMKGSVFTETLEEWETPDLQAADHTEVTTADILAFRRALDFVGSAYPLCASLGKATTREGVIESVQNVFERIVGNTRQDSLDFQVLCQVAELPDGQRDWTKVRELIKMFRPSREGETTKLDFIRSTDEIHKTLSLLLANVTNSSQLYYAYERIVNQVFYALAFVIVLAIPGVDTKIFISGMGVLVLFVLLIGTSMLRYIEGVVFILARKQYDIGDRVCFHLSTDPENNEDPLNGGCIVEKVDLFNTTVRLATTREYATFNNGSLASTRIVNLRRSERANVFFHFKYTINATRKQLKIFKQKMEDYLKDRPREWVKLNSFRCTRIETCHQYIEYTMVVQHREPWQNFGFIQQSKSNVFLYALDLQRELKVTFTDPHLPGDLHVLGSAHDVTGTLEPNTTNTLRPSIVENKKMR